MFWQCPDILRYDPQDLRQAMSIHTEDNRRLPG